MSEPVTAMGTSESTALYRERGEHPIYTLQPGMNEPVALVIRTPQNESVFIHYAGSVVEFRPGGITKMYPTVHEFDKQCGDYPAPCNCDNPLTHGGRR